MSPILRVLLWLDIKLLVVLTFGKCKPGETISAAAWSLKLDDKWQGHADVWMIDKVMRPFDGPDHCKRAYAEQINLYK